jgi:hypothetical protein
MARSSSNSAPLLAWNGRSPHSSSYRITPNEYTSESVVTGWASNCSGLA